MKSRLYHLRSNEVLWNIHGCNLGPVCNQKGHDTRRVPSGDIMIYTPPDDSWNVQSWDLSSSFMFGTIWNQKGHGSHVVSSSSSVVPSPLDFSQNGQTCEWPSSFRVLTLVCGIQGTMRVLCYIYGYHFGPFCNQKGHSSHGMPSSDNMVHIPPENYCYWNEKNLALPSSVRVCKYACSIQGTMRCYDMSTILILAHFMPKNTMVAVRCTDIILWPSLYWKTPEICKAEPCHPYTGYEK